MLALFYTLRIRVPLSANRFKLLKKNPSRLILLHGGPECDSFSTPPLHHERKIGARTLPVMTSSLPHPDFVNSKNKRHFLDFHTDVCLCTNFCRDPII